MRCPLERGMGLRTSYVACGFAPSLPRGFRYHCPNGGRCLGPNGGPLPGANGSGPNGGPCPGPNGPGCCTAGAPCCTLSFQPFDARLVTQQPSTSNTGKP